MHNFIFFVMNLFVFIINTISWIMFDSISHWTSFFCGTSIILIGVYIDNIIKEWKEK